MSRNLSIIFVALCFIFLIVIVGVVFYYTSVINDLNSQVANKPLIVVDGLSVEDLRRGTGNNLRIFGFVNNTGGGTAYGLRLHVFAVNAEGVAIDEYKNLGGITAGMSLGVDFGLVYAGSRIESWAITPICSDGSSAPLNGTLPFGG
jgi:hypothetical protein